MKTADDIAQNAAHSYQILKAHLLVREEESTDCVPILELHFKNGRIQPVVLESRDAVPTAIVAMTEKYPDDLVACALNLEVYASSNEERGDEFDKALPFEHEDVLEGLLTIAVTSNGEHAVKLFRYYFLDDGGIEFEERELKPESLGTLVYEMRGLWARQGV